MSIRINKDQSPFGYSLAASLFVTDGVSGWAVFAGCHRPLHPLGA